MSQSVVCSGCGARLEVGEDYTRKKMRCGQCGVIFDLPEPAHRSSIPAPPAKSEARSQRSEVRGQRSEVRGQRSEVRDQRSGVRGQGSEGDIASFSPESTAKAPSKTDVRSQRSEIGSQRPEVASASSRRSTEAAPSTNIKSRSPATSTPAPSTEPPPDDSDDDEFAFSDGTDTRAYEKTGEEIRECPFCHATVRPEVDTCGACGFMLTELKTESTGHSLARRWESGWSFRGRLIGFLVCQILSVASVVGGIIAGLNPFTLVFPYVMYTGMTAFLFGSYNWVDLNRNKKGQLRLMQTWRICFIERPPTVLKSRDYEELASGVDYNFDATDWIVLLFLILIGILPGLWWWVYAGSKDTYFVSLCRDHGYPVVTLYRGWDQEKMEDMAETISKVARLPLRRA